jgi:DNA replication protein DnaC
MEQFDSSVVETTSYDMLNGAAQFDNRAFMRDLKCSDIVIVDDIDKAHWTHKELYFLWGLTNSLCENGGRMIITSNLAPANFRAYFAEASAGNESLIEAIVQRLEKMQVIHVDGESLRGLDTEKRAPRRQR